MRQPINNSSRVPAYQNGEKSSVSATFRVASPFEGSLGGSTPLLVRFLGVSERSTSGRLLPQGRKKMNAVSVPLELLYSSFSLRPLNNENRDYIWSIPVW